MSVYVGTVLRCSTGTWDGATTITFQWTRAGVDVPGATAATYTTGAADVGSTIGCIVTAHNTYGDSATAATNPELVLAQPTSGYTGLEIRALDTHENASSWVPIPVEEFVPAPPPPTIADRVTYAPGPPVSDPDGIFVLPLELPDGSPNDTLIWEELGVDRYADIWPESIVADSDEWGPSSLSFTLKRLPSTPIPDLRKFTPIEYWRDGVRRWSGRIKDAPSFDGPRAFQTNVTAEGWQFSLDDDPFTENWVIGKNGSWQDLREAPVVDLNPNDPAGTWLAEGPAAAGQIERFNQGAIELSFAKGTQLIDYQKCGVYLDVRRFMNNQQLFFEYFATNNHQAPYLRLILAGSFTPHFESSLRRVFYSELVNADNMGFHDVRSLTDLAPMPYLGLFLENDPTTDPDWSGSSSSEPVAQGWVSNFDALWTSPVKIFPHGVIAIDLGNAPNLQRGLRYDPDYSARSSSQHPLCDRQTASTYAAALNTTAEFRAADIGMVVGQVYWIIIGYRCSGPGTFQVGLHTSEVSPAQHYTPKLPIASHDTYGVAFLNYQPNPATSDPSIWVSSEDTRIAVRAFHFGQNDPLANDGSFICVDSLYLIPIGATGRGPTYGFTFFAGQSVPEVVTDPGPPASYGPYRDSIDESYDDDRSAAVSRIPVLADYQAPLGLPVDPTVAQITERDLVTGEMFHTFPGWAGSPIRFYCLARNAEIGIRVNGQWMGGGSPGGAPPRGDGWGLYDLGTLATGNEPEPAVDVYIVARDPTRGPAEISDYFFLMRPTETVKPQVLKDDVRVRITKLLVSASDPRAVTDEPPFVSETGAVSIPPHKIIRDALVMAPFLLWQDASLIGEVSDDSLTEYFVQEPQTAREIIQGANALAGWITKVMVDRRFLFQPSGAVTTYIGDEAQLEAAAEDSGEDSWNGSIVSGQDLLGLPYQSKRGSSSAFVTPDTVDVAEADVAGQDWAFNTPPPVGWAGQLLGQASYSAGSWQMYCTSPVLGSAGHASFFKLGEAFKVGAEYLLTLTFTCEPEVATDGVAGVFHLGILGGNFRKHVRTVVMQASSPSNKETITLDFVANDPWMGIYICFGAVVSSIQLCLTVDTFSLQRVVQTVLDQRSMRRTKILDVSTALTPQLAETVHRTFVQQSTPASFRGSVSIQGPEQAKLQADDSSVPPAAFLDRVGESIELRSRVDPDSGTVGRTARIVSVSYDSTTDTATIGLDNARHQLELLLARMAAVR